MNLDLVRAFLWDVRAQWESGVRRLTSIQSSLEDPIRHDRESCVAGLRQDAQALTEINATVRRLLEEVDRALK